MHFGIKTRKNVWPCKPKLNFTFCYDTASVLSTTLAYKIFQYKAVNRNTIKVNSSTDLIRFHNTIMQHTACNLSLSRLMGEPTICICENKDADQLRGNREADQRLCYRYTDSTLPLLFKSEISSFQPASVTAQPNLCQTCSETTLLVFPRGGSFVSLTNRTTVFCHVEINDDHAKL